MIPAAVADSWFFWLAIIGFVAGVYVLPTVIAIARQVEGLGWVICLANAGDVPPVRPVPRAIHAGHGSLCLSV